MFVLHAVPTYLRSVYYSFPEQSFYFHVRTENGRRYVISIIEQSKAKARRSINSAFTGFDLHVLVCGSFRAENSSEADCVRSCVDICHNVGESLSYKGCVTRGRY